MEKELPKLPFLPYYTHEQRDVMDRAVQTLFIRIALKKELPKCLERVTGFIKTFNTTIQQLDNLKVDTEPFIEGRNFFVLLKMLIQIHMETYTSN